MTSREHSTLLLGCACALVATIIWSGNFIIARDLGTQFPPVRLALLRWGTAALAVLPFGLRALLRERRELLRCLPYVTAASVLGVTLFNTLIYIAGRHTSALNLALIATFTPVFIMALAALFLGERAGLRGAAGAVLATAGVLALITGGDPSRLTGLAINQGDVGMLAAAVIFAAYSILVRRRPANISQMAQLTATFLLGTALLVPWAAWEAAGLEPGSTVLSARIVGSVLYVGVGASLMAYFCWSKAVELIGPTLAGMIYFSLPLFSGLEAALVLGESITWLHGASGACIVGGIALATKHTQKPARA